MVKTIGAICNSTVLLLYWRKRISYPKAPTSSRRKTLEPTSSRYQSAPGDRQFHGTAASRPCLASSFPQGVVPEKKRPSNKKSQRLQTTPRRSMMNGRSSWPKENFYIGLSLDGPRECTTTTASQGAKTTHKSRQAFTCCAGRSMSTACVVHDVTVSTDPGLPLFQGSRAYLQFRRGRKNGDRQSGASASCRSRLRQIMNTISTK